MGRISSTFRKSLMVVLLTGSMVGLSACDPNATSVNAGVGIYYDSMLWNDYYYHGARPPHRPPNRPPPPGTRPPRPEHPIARPPIARPPIHRPPGGGGRPRRR